MPPLPKMPNITIASLSKMPNITTQVDCIKKCGLVDPCRVDCAKGSMKCLSAGKKDLAECSKESNECQASCTATQNRDANCLTNCLMSQGKSLSGSPLSYLDRIKLHANSIKNRVRGQVNVTIDKIKKNRDTLAETARDGVNNFTKMAQNRTKNASDTVAKRMNGTLDKIRKNCDKIAETTRDGVKNFTKLAQDSMKNASDTVAKRVN